MTRSNLSSSGLTSRDLTCRCLAGSSLTSRSLAEREVTRGDLAISIMTCRCLTGSRLSRSSLTRRCLAGSRLTSSSLTRRRVWILHHCLKGIRLHLHGERLVAELDVTVRNLVGAIALRRHDRACGLIGRRRELAANDEYTNCDQSECRRRDQKPGVIEPGCHWKPPECGRGGTWGHCNAPSIQGSTVY
jgi:hypothetical protein